jgi:hypothetical protein
MDVKRRKEDEREKGNFSCEITTLVR